MKKKKIVIDGVVYVPEREVSEDRNTGYRNTGDSNTGDRNTGDSNTGNWNTGSRNTGYRNTGYRNTGDWNTGDRNTGSRNTGYRNTGYRNTGDWNTGDSNTGNWNTGSSNTGNRNTGNLNTGYLNTGYWNTGNLNTGYLNTTEPKVRIFNKDCNIARDDFGFPDYFYFDTTEWIPENAMTEEEKIEHDTYKTTGGYLKSYEYQEAWRRSWDNASDEDRRKTLELPNWNNELFLEISGIDVEKELSVKGKEYSLDEVANALGVDVKELKIKKD
jgi:hypothetical protein